MAWINNLAIMVNANEKSIPIIKLFFDCFRKYHLETDIPIYVVANKFRGEVPTFPNVKYISSEVEWQSNGTHFSDTVATALQQIPEEYVFMFCEDYMLTQEIDVPLLQKVFNFVVDTDLDMFSFASIVQSVNFKPIVADYKQYGLENEKFYYSADDYLHKFSVQPCIWKKSALLRVVSENQLSMPDLDCSRIENKEQYKVGCTTYRIFDVCSTCPERFVISYLEIIRHGVFPLIWNGHPVDKNSVYHKFLVNMILDNNLDKNPEYDKYMGFDKSVLRS